MVAYITLAISANSLLERRSAGEIIAPLGSGADQWLTAQYRIRHEATRPAALIAEEHGGGGLLPSIAALAYGDRRMGTDPQQLFGAGLGIEHAEGARDLRAFVLERRHADGQRWVQVNRFPARADAEAVLEELVEKGGEDRDKFRIRKVR